MTTRSKKLCSIEIHCVITENHDGHFVVYCANNEIEKIIPLFKRHKSNFVPRIGLNNIKIRYNEDKPVFSHKMTNIELIENYIAESTTVNVTVDCRFSSWKTDNGSTNTAISFIAKKILVAQTDLESCIDKVVFCKN